MSITRYRLACQPSRKDRKTNPHLPEDANVLVELHAIELDSGEWLYLVASMKLSNNDAAELYGRRYDVEQILEEGSGSPVCF